MNRECRIKQIETDLLELEDDIETLQALFNRLKINLDDLKAGYIEDSTWDEYADELSGHPFKHIELF